jgi:hypothetical protein
VHKVNTNLRENIQKYSKLNGVFKYTFKKTWDQKYNQDRTMCFCAQTDIWHETWVLGNQDNKTIK